MSIGYGCGRHEAAKLSLEQIGVVLKATGVTCVVERIAGKFVDVRLLDGELSTLIPGNTQQSFVISRRIDGVPDRYSKSLSVAVGEPMTSKFASCSAKRRFTDD